MQLHPFTPARGFGLAHQFREDQHRIRGVLGRNTYRHDAPRWTEQVDRAAAQCKVPGMREVVIRSGPEPWYSLVTVPCHLLKRNNWCQPGYCVEVGAAGAAVDPRRLSRHPTAGLS